jgi:D-3-phosphoglycerate dehydrogenase / 2-oxoglutarate reductase
MLPSQEVAVSFEVFQADPSPELEPYTWEREALGAAGGTFVMGGCLTQDEIIERAGDADVLWLSWSPAIDGRVLEALPKVRLAIRWGVGFEQIDTIAATRLGVAVGNAPTYGTTDVAETAMALLLSVARHTAYHHAALATGGWTRAVAGTHRLRGRTLGIIGCGRIGSSVAGMAAGFGLRVVGTDLVRTADQLGTAGIEMVDLDTLLAQADYVSLHIPYTAANHHFVDAGLLSRLKPGAILVNTARGKVVDTPALIAALESGHLAGAGLDVFEDEPLPPDAAIRSAPNVVLTPHIASHSVEAFTSLRAEMVRTTIDFMTTGWASTIVNPEVRGQLRGA